MATVRDSDVVLIREIDLEHTEDRSALPAVDDIYWDWVCIASRFRYIDPAESCAFTGWQTTPSAMRFVCRRLMRAFFIVHEPNSVIRNG